MGSMKTSIRVVLTVALLALALPMLVNSGTVMKMKVHTDAMEMMGQKMPAQDDIITSYYSGKMARSDQGDSSSVIIDGEKKVMFMLNHVAKEVIRMELGKLMDGLGKTLDSAAAEADDEEGAEQVAEIAKAMQQGMTATVTPSDEKKEIAGYNCSRYDAVVSMSMMTTNQEIWATEDIEIDFDMYELANLGMQLQMPGVEKMIEEMRKIKGVAVLTTTTASMMGMNLKSTQELLEVRNEDVPASMFVIPEDYKSVESPSF